jgi:hypothetical protein
MLLRVMDNVRPQISAPPGPQPGTDKNQQRTGSHDCATKVSRSRTAWHERPRQPMSQRSHGVDMIERAQSKPDGVNRADNKESLFKLKLRRAHNL